MNVSEFSKKKKKNSAETHMFINKVSVSIIP